MPELVNDLGPDADREPGRLAGKPHAGETRGGYDGDGAFQLRLAEDERQDWDEEVRVREADQARGSARPVRREPQEDAMGGVLFASFVERFVRPARGELEARRSAEHPLDLNAHAREKFRVHVSRPDPPQGDLAHVPTAGPAAPSAAIGSRIVIVVPCPATLVTRIAPPCFSTMP